MTAPAIRCEGSRDGKAWAARCWPNRRQRHRQRLLRRKLDDLRQFKSDRHAPRYQGYVEKALVASHGLAPFPRSAGQSRRALCVLSPDYFADNRMVQLKSLGARAMDPSGQESGLIPLIFRPTSLPPWLRDLVPVDWVDPTGRAREWRRLLGVLGAPGDSHPPDPQQQPDQLIVAEAQAPSGKN